MISSTHVFGIWLGDLLKQNWPKFLVSSPVSFRTRLRVYRRWRGQCPPSLLRLTAPSQRKHPATTNVVTIIDVVPRLCSRDTKTNRRMISGEKIVNKYLSLVEEILLVAQNDLREDKLNTNNQTGSLFHLHPNWIPYLRRESKVIKVITYWNPASATSHYQHHPYNKRGKYKNEEEQKDGENPEKRI